MKCYRYNDVEDYVHHVKELQKQGFHWCRSTREEEYRPYYYEYVNFVLFVDEEENSSGELSYGHSGWLDEGQEVILYTRKKSNINSY